LNIKLKNGLILSLLAAVIASLYCIIYRYGVNVPHWDDHAVRVFVEDWKTSDLFRLFSFHNEHRIAFTRFIALLVNGIFGELNFKHMMYVGQAGLVGVIGWFIFWVNRLKIETVWLLIPALLIFNPSTFENSLWAMAAVQNHWVIFWAFSALSFLILASENVSKKQSGFFIAAVLLSLITHLTSGNAVILAPLGIMLLLFAGKWRLLWIWLFAHSIFYFFYFQGFERFGMSTRPHLERFLINLFNLSGSLSYPLLNKNISVKLPLLAGILQLIFTIRVFFKILFRKDNKSEVLSYFAFAGFLWGTLVLVAAGRSDYDPMVLLSSKYKIYSFLILAVNGLYFMRKPKSGAEITKTDFLFAGMTLFFFANAWVSYIDDVKNLKRERIAYLVNLKFMGAGNSPIYKPHKLAIEDVLVNKTKTTSSGASVSFEFEKDKINFRTLVSDYETDYYLWLESEQHKQLIALNAENTLSGKSNTRNGSLLLYDIPSDTYRIYLAESTREGVRLKDTKEEIRIEGVKYTAPKTNW
jgi:hypothetical protein